MLRILFFIPITVFAQVNQTVIDAYNTGNKEVLDAVIEKQIKQDPKVEEKLETYLKKLEKKAKKTKNYSGNIDSSINFVNGNTKQQDVNLSAKLNYKKNNWKNITKLSTTSSKENNLTTNEEYILSNQTKYKYNRKNYSFIELEAVKDRFSGYDYRLSELVGYGRELFKNDKVEILGELSVGGRQSELTNNEKEETLTSKISTKINWAITEKISFEQDISTSFGADAQITNIDSSIKTNIIDSIYLKINNNFQHIDEVPTGTKNSDSNTFIGIGYNF